MNDAELLRIGVETAVIAQLSLFALFLAASAGKRPPAVFFIAALCAAIATTLLINVLASAGIAPRIRVANYFIDLAIAPLVLGFAARAGEKAPALRRKDWAHLAILLAGAAMLRTPWDAAPDAFVLSIHLGYLAAACWIGLQRREALRSARLEIFTAVLLGAFALVWLLRVWVVLDAHGLLSYRASPAYPAILFVTLALASFMLWTTMRQPALLVRASSGKGDESDNLERRLVDLIDSERLYLEPNLTVADVAARLRVSPRSVSQVATRLGENFSTVLNQRRAKAAARLLEMDEPPSITAIMFDSGFGSKSAFQREFKRHIGVSPTEYRRRLRGPG